MKKRELKGSMTIEASLLMPLIVFLIWNVLYMSFFAYNQSCALQGNYCTALRTERHCKKEEKNELAEKKYELSVKERLVCADSAKEIEITNKNVAVTTSVTMHAPGAGFFHSTWQGKQRQQADVWQPVTFIRLCRSAENILDVIQDENE